MAVLQGVRGTCLVGGVLLGGHLGGRGSGGEAVLQGGYLMGRLPCGKGGLLGRLPC